MLSQYFHLKPTPSWPTLLLLNTILAIISYCGGMPVFFKTALMMGLFLFLIAKTTSHDGHTARLGLGMVLFLAVVLFPYFAPNTWQLPGMLWLKWGFIPLLGMFICAIHYFSLHMRPERSAMTPDTATIAPLDSMHVWLYTSTILFNLSYTISLCLISLIAIKNHWHISSLTIAVFSVIFSMVCALARQSILEQKQRILAQGGEWIRIDINGIQKQSWHRPTIQNGLKKSCMQQETVSWQNITGFHESNNRIVVKIKNQPPYNDPHTVNIPLITPFYSLNELCEHLKHMKQQLG